MEKTLEYESKTSDITKYVKFSTKKGIFGKYLENKYQIRLTSIFNGIIFAKCQRNKVMSKMMSLNTVSSDFWESEQIKKIES